MCNDQKRAVMGTVEWNERFTPARFTARLPWTPLTEVGEEWSTCEEAADQALLSGHALGMGIINSRGQDAGQVLVWVTEPEHADCDGLTGVSILADLDSDEVMEYDADGCLDKGKMVWQ